LISTKSYRVKYNTGSGYPPSLLRNAQPVRGYAGLLRNMSKLYITVYIVVFHRQNRNKYNCFL
ncbi:MAG: hypothetical protein LBL33_07660, partial [Tannerella sp.]|nr:hypothetical protein [Tannerella sp.]